MSPSAPWLILGAIYGHLGEPLRLLWHADVHRSTIHVTDLCRAIWTVCVSSKLVSGQVFNVSDGSNCTMGDVAEIVSGLFNIQYNFVGKTLSTIANVWRQTASQFCTSILYCWIRKKFIPLKKFNHQYFVRFISCPLLNISIKKIDAVLAVR